MLGFGNGINLYFRRSNHFIHLNHQLCFLTTEENYRPGKTFRGFLSNDIL